MSANHWDHHLRPHTLGVCTSIPVALILWGFFANSYIDYIHSGTIFPITAYLQGNNYSCEVAFCEDNEELEGNDGVPGTVECYYLRTAVAAYAESSSISEISGTSGFEPFVRVIGSSLTPPPLLLNPLLTQVG
jgi:hypothetical protein